MREEPTEEYPTESTAMRMNAFIIDGKTEMSVFTGDDGGRRRRIYITDPANEH